MGVLWVTGVVAVRDKQPYIQLSNENGIVAQLSAAEARSFANDIITMISRTEADALLHRFAETHEMPEQFGAQLMQMFRDFRAEIDAQEVDRKQSE